MNLKYKISLFFLFLGFATAFSQGSPYYKGGFKIKFGDNDDKYVRIITWAQAQANYSDDRPEDQSDVSFQLRRARILVYGQIVKDFLVLTHIGMNSLNANNMQPVGNEGTPQVFMHDAWAQYNVAKNHVIGGGLHYWNGLSRLNSQGTLNLMTMDNNRASWSNLGLSDQFARHIGIFAKGNFGRLQYNVAVNEAIVNTLDTQTLSTDYAVYQGANLLGTANAGKVYTGYFAYNLLNMESNFLPYKVGSYLGTQELLNVGAGFFHHPEGSVILNDEGEQQGENVNLFALDVFYDVPIGAAGASLTAYAKYQYNDYGTNYQLGPYSTGNMWYAHTGYLLPGDFQNTRFQPYASFNYSTIDALQDDRSIFGIGANAYLNGHNSKLTLEFQSENFNGERLNRLSLQAMIYL
ncbi:hypothetical protein [Psychroflexus planctonicus]|uniref:Short chain amide porin n=1 Tax=Psychroflexus planctonicus TaxID=1526575 RepID=A0ABQ1SM41_9FLAO|nr:hypothetical protein [Psychroflexus planctonicus]GGE43669.1 hypothetical protein GCM10010832_24590 [Psychroflexus planctonicus]